MSSIHSFRRESQSALVPASDNGSAQLPDYYPCIDAYGRPTDWDSGGPSEYWRIVGRSKGTLFLSAFLGALVAFLITRALSPVYRARTLIEVESLNEDFLNKRNVSPTASAGGSFAPPEYNIRTQTTVLQSRPVLERAIDKIDLEKRLLANKQAGRTFLRRKAQGVPEHEAGPPRDQALSVVEDDLKVRPEQNTRVIEVTFDSTDSGLAADVVNSIAVAFTELSLEKRWETAQHTSEWLTRELADVRNKLQAAEDALQKYARTSGLTFISEKDNVAEQSLRELQLELSKAQAERVARQSRYELAATAPAESLGEVLDDPVLKDYQVQLTTLQRQLAELTSSFTSEHPKVVNVQAQIATVEAALEKKRSNIITRIRNEFGAALRRERLLNTEYAGQLGLISKQSDKVARYLTLKREVDSTRQLHDLIFQRAKEAGLASAMRASDIHVIESARPPRIPYKPNVFLDTTLGFLGGICGGIAFVVIRVRSARGVREPGDTTFELNVPELGVIPANNSVTGAKFYGIRRLLGKPELQGLATAGEGRLELTTWQQWPSPMAESFRLTLTSILLGEKNQFEPRVIAVSSANPGEGKTTVISNLGIALARVKRNVLLVDGDMRKPRLHDVFEVDNSIGLSDVLAGNSTPAVRETKIPNLFLLPSGQSGDERLLFGPELSRLLLGLRSRFDMVLVDTPPLLHMSDARLIAHDADAVILVVTPNTPRDTVLLTHQRLAEDGSHLLGTILNNWNPKTSMRGYRGYYDYYNGNGKTKSGENNHRP